MLAYFVIGLFLLVALLVGGHSLANTDPKKLAKALKISAAIILGLIAGFLVLTGRFAYAPPVIIAALMFLRNRPLFGSGSGPSPGQTSSVDTNWLKASLNHDNGEMDADIIRGSFEGKKLSDLTLDQLLELQEECKEDEQTVTILNTFAERYFSEQSEDNQYQKHSSKEEYTRAQSGGGSMTRREALEILELQDNASLDEIKAAHRKLMKKFHPDHNGSDYMAAKINEAKDLLIRTN